MEQSLIYDVKIQSLRLDGKIKATASVNINHAFAVRGVTLMEGTKGLFVSMPSYKAGNGEYKDICFPCTKESRKAFDDAVINAYEHALIQKQKTKEQQNTSTSEKSQSQVMSGM